VVNELVRDPVSDHPESPLDAGLVALIPVAAFALQRLHEAGFALVGVTNQPAAAKGTVQLADLESVQTRVLELLEQAGVSFDRFEICFHHPRGVVAELTRTCECRKPAPGMLFAAAAELGLDLARSWLVGDTDDDMRAGIAAGCRTVLVENPGSSHKRTGSPASWARVPDLSAAAEVILRAER
jgi:D-glycero-D-manno-heptose 1,7-bisphosphate phosphatase